LGLKKHDLNADLIKVYLTNATPSTSADSVLLDLADISAGNGYTAGGDDITNAYSEATGTGTMTAVDVTFTASGGTIGPFRYAVIYNDTQTAPADPLIAWWDHGSALTLNDGESFTVDFGASVFTIA